MVGDDADLRLAGRDQSGTVRPDQLGAGVLDESAGANHVIEGDAFGDADDQPDAGGGRLHDGVSREWRGHEDPAHLSAGLPSGIGDGIEDRDAKV